MVQRDTGQVLGDDLGGLDGPPPGAVVDGRELDSPEALSEKLGLLAAGLGEFPLFGVGCLGRLGLPWRAR
jgi:hypothetical protein